MDVATIRMPREEAARAYREYRQACRGNPTDQDRAVMMGLSALRRGHAVIDVREAMRAAGLDGEGLPRLAIARAGWEWCHLEVKYGGTASVCFGMERWASARGRRPKDGRPPYRLIEFPRDTFVGAVRDRTANNRRPRAAVPFIPPSVRPANLDDYFLLWEAVWEPSPPTDPMLLRHLHGFLYAVLAVWDLTELERAVMGQRLA